MKMFVTFFGAGLSPKAPGTVGTLAAIPLVLLMSYLPPLIYAAICIVVMIVAIWASDQYEKEVGGHDRSEIVIDEVVGFMVTMALMPRTWQAFALGFLLFRILDIWKPLFIGLIDRKGRGGLGVVADDVVAGIVANIILQYVYSQTDLLGAQWMS